MAGHVFISYSRSDTAYVDRLVAHLGAAGVSAWVDHKIHHGDRWASVIENQITTCAAFVAVMTPPGGRVRMGRTRDPLRPAAADTSTRTGEPSAAFHTRTVSSKLAVGRLLVAGSGWGDGTIHVWDAMLGRQLARFTGHRDSVTAVAFAADGQRVASASTDGFQVWEIGRAA